MNEPQWLLWARQLQSIAQTGLAFNTNPFDIERYEAIRSLAAEAMAAHSAAAQETIESLFRGETGYPTPKIDVRAAVFDSQGRILLVREVMDDHRWTLPGGWADVNLSASASAVKEVREESGYEVRILRPVAIWDRAKQGHPPSVYSCLKMFFLCEPTGGNPAISIETSAVGWFARADLPTDWSIGRTLPRQVERMFEHHADPGLPIDYD
ncbi:MAG TPA: NUDIX hydrolase [Steroidobacteraceae bacterium]|nr:NUDIX hydrolase [Steroidobacteraceae bacterium]